MNIQPAKNKFILTLTCFFIKTTNLFPFFYKFPPYVQDLRCAIKLLLDLLYGSRRVSAQAFQPSLIVASPGPVYPMSSVRQCQVCCLMPQWPWQNVPRDFRLSPTQRRDLQCSCWPLEGNLSYRCPWLHRVDQTMLFDHLNL